MCKGKLIGKDNIPGIITQYEELTAKLKADVPILEAIISKTWGKEDELKQLKSELAALDRKITAELAPSHEVPDDRKGVNHDENYGTENRQEQTRQSQPEVKAETVVNTVNVHTTDPPQGHKPSMVAEPQPRYPMPASMPRFPARHSGILLYPNGQIRLQCLVCILFFCITAQIEANIQIHSS